MNDTSDIHMSPDEFRQWGHSVVDWIANYQQRVESLPVMSRVQPGEIRAVLPESAPESGESFETILGDFERLILPGITHWQSPNFFGYFPCNNSGPAILADLLSSGLGVQGMLWATSPACTELETLVLDWLVEAMGLPDRFVSTGNGGGVIQDAASSAVLCALVAARERTLSGVVHRSGNDPRLVAYTSAQAHSSVEKAMGIAGVGRDKLRLIEVDEQYAMRVDRLAEAIERDRSQGLLPFFVCATVGTTSSTAVDPVPQIGKICHRAGLWLHVDGAYAGTAALCPEFRFLNEGLAFADSYCFNPHKWMLTNFDCSCFFVADRAALVSALGILPEYLKNQATQAGAVIDYRDWQIPLGRRFRALKLWFVLRHYGTEGLRRHVRHHVRLAQEFASWVRSNPDFELVTEPILSLVCFRRKGSDEFNRGLLERLNGSGGVFLTHTMLGGRYVLRLCVGQWRTEERHLRAAWEALRAEG
jgi:aromatic-L-amino-acid decarboxylase